jgi:Histidine phosphatase superfamily (branch 1)
MLPPLKILLVRHAQPVHFEDVPGHEHHDGPRSEWNNRPLSPQEILDAQELSATLAVESPISIYSSPYLRVRQTVEPLARHLRIAITEIDGLRERLLGADLTDDWNTHMRRAWEDFDYCLRWWRIKPGGARSSPWSTSRPSRATRNWNCRGGQPWKSDCAGVECDGSRDRLRFLEIDAVAGRLLIRTRGERLARSRSRTPINAVSSPRLGSDSVVHRFIRITDLMCSFGNRNSIAIPIRRGLRRFTI